MDVGVGAAGMRIGGGVFTIVIGFGVGGTGGRRGTSRILVMIVHDGNRLVGCG